MIFIAKFSDQVFKFSINNSIKELLWLPISARKKLQTKPIIDGVLRSGVEGLSGLIIFLLVVINILPESQIHFLSILSINRNYSMGLEFIWISKRIYILYNEFDRKSPIES